MQIVPVIDLMDGRVVHAVRGERERYRSIESVLCRGDAPAQVAECLCEHCATDTLYVADLDALRGRPPQIDALGALLDARAGLRLWLDAGYRGAADFNALRAALGPAGARVVPVFGSETLASRDGLAQACAAHPEALLSLDRRAGAALDAAGLWDAPALWPQRLIVMTLDRVGSSLGPDLETLAAVRARAPQAMLVGAGGVRDEADLAACEAAGASAWLLASALHAGRIAPRTGATECRAIASGGGNLSRLTQACALGSARMGAASGHAGCSGPATGAHNGTWLA